jgi:fucose permease
MKLNYKHTVYACFIGYIVQAIINNFAPLLFVTFQASYRISLERITLLVTFNFGIQLLVDFISPWFLKKIGYRVAVIIAQVFAAAGLVSMTILPEILPDAYTGLLVSVIIYAIGGGLLEVLISPIVEACPTKNKESVMSLLHSFYCWGHMAVVLISTLYFTLFGIANWRFLAIFWAVIPLLNAFFFVKVPVQSLEESNGEELPVRKLITKRTFWLMVVLMLCAGASEQAVSQWASTFSEAGLGVNKTIGDLTGPMAFALFMGISRVLFAKFSEKVKLEKFMMMSGVLCIISYLLISLPSNPAINLAGCAICGFSVGILWPGTFSIASKTIRGGGTSMFAFLALAGDLGCSAGPTFVGYISDSFGSNLKMGILFALIFPSVLIFALLINSRKNNRKAFSNV